MGEAVIDIIRYTADRADEWNRFVDQSKNGTFLFDRGYMDYHADRFEDYSLMFFRDGRLFALLPANRDGDTLFSHRGLTYGGLVMDAKTTTAVVRDLFRELCDYLRAEGLHRVVYKPVPWPYAALPSAEDQYALVNVCRAKIIQRDVASVVVLADRLPLSTLRKRGVAKACRAGVTIAESWDFETYWSLLEDRLRDRHGARPIHSLREMTLLRERFPEHIRLFAAFLGGRMVGGTVLYITATTAKTQYIAADDAGLACGALDLLFAELLDRFGAEGWRFFDFGTSNMPGCDDLHDSLIFQKEGFGARAVCYDTYEYDL